MMKKSQGFSVSSRPQTSKKTSPQQNPLVGAMKKMTIETKDFNITSEEQLEINKLHQTIDELIMRQKECQNSGKYVEAQSCKRKVQALREVAEKREVEEIRDRHKGQVQEIEQAHLEEMNCFNIQWDKILTQLHQQITQMEQELYHKQQQQILSVEDQINSEKPKNFKESPQLLNLRKIQQELAKQQNYLEAHQVQRKAEKLQKQQLQKWKKNQQSKGKTNLALLKNKHEAEINALKQKIQLALDQKQRQRNIEEQRLILKYQNVMKELLFQQNQEILKYEKITKLSHCQKKSKPGQYGTTSRTSLA